MKRLAVFASGEGTNFEAIATACRRGEIPAEVVLCVSDCPGAPVERRAERLGVPMLILDPSEFPDREAYERQILQRLHREAVDLICLAGYMRIVGETLLEAYPRRILNIHPSLLPAFKGRDAIRRAFRYGVKVFGVTVHYVDATIDGGEIIAQEAMNYDGGDFVELEEKIHRIEHRLYPLTIKRIILGI